VSSTADSDITKLAVAALLQSEGAPAKAALRSYGQRTDLPPDTRKMIVLRLLQDESAENGEFLRQAYGRLERDDQLRSDVVQAVARIGDSVSARWLLDIAADTLETPTSRSQALTLAGRTAAVSDLVNFYAPTLTDTLRANLLDIYVQRGDSTVLDGLAAIAKHDPDMGLRKAAVAHIAQSQDPHAAEVLQDILGER
jgi:hypothetical protein